MVGFDAVSAVVAAVSVAPIVAPAAAPSLEAAVVAAAGMTATKGCYLFCSFCTSAVVDFAVIAGAGIELLRRY